MDITLTLLKRCKTVTSEEVNATKNVSISDGINKHVPMQRYTILYNTINITDKVFKNVPSEICGRQPLKNLK